MSTKFAPVVTLENGEVYIRINRSCIASSHSVEAILLHMILQRMPDPTGPLSEAVEWESEDGINRTTDKAMAANWAPHMNVRVVRRAAPAEPDGLAGSA